KFFFTLWNKAFSGKIARHAFSFVEDGRFPRAQDLYAVFILLYFSKSYFGISDVLINYNFGFGITGAKLYKLSSFERFAQSSKTADGIARFAQARNINDRYERVLDNLRHNLIL